MCQSQRRNAAVIFNILKQGAREGRCWRGDELTHGGANCIRCRMRTAADAAEALGSKGNRSHQRASRSI